MTQKHTVVERSVTIDHLSEEQFRAVEAAMEMPLNWLGRWKGGDKVTFSEDLRNEPDGLHQADVTKAVLYAQDQGLAYEYTVTTRYEQE